MNISIKVTKKFSYPWSYKDILVLELAEDVRFDETVQPICLPLGYRERVGEIAIFAGFGKKEVWGTEGAPDRKGRPPQRESSPTARENIIPLRKGDSGGPLVVNRKGTHFAVGVTAHGLPYLYPYPHQRFTRVAEHCWWIERDTEGEVKCIEME
ncbi:fed tick salivary protein 10 [Aphelenchoides avenae]|nr:fed tick salivary protein 10 [Aphelenchus avenae]